MAILQKIIKKINNPFFLVLTVIIGVSSLLYFYKLGDTYLSHWDEAWYADVSRTMAATGNIATPVWNTQPFFEKAPLYYWFSALGYLLFEDGEIAARFFSALSGVVTVSLVYWFVSKQTKKIDAGLVASLILISVIGFSYRARTGNLDVFQTMWIVLSLISFIKALQSGKRNYFNLAGVFSGLAFLAKGFSGLIIVLIAAVSLLTKQTACRRMVLNMIVVCTIIIVAWISWYYMVNGEEFIKQFFFHQADKIQGTGRFIDHFSLDAIKYLYQGMKYWILLFIPSYIFSIIKLRRKNYQILFLVITAYLVIFSFVESKNNWLLVPVYPLSAMLIAFGYNEFIKRFRMFRLPVVVVIVLISIIQLVQFKQEYIVADVNAQDAQIAQMASAHTFANETIYLTHYYYPASVYYSNRKILAVYSDNEKITNWWIRPWSEWDDILKSKRVTVISTPEDVDKYSDLFNKYNLIEIGRIGDRILLQKDPIYEEE